MIPLFTVLFSVNKFLEPLRNFFTDIITLNPVLLQLAVFGLLLGGVYALAALGLTMIFGVMDIINFAHGMLLVVGMYTAWWVTTTFGLHPFLALPIVVVFLFVLGVILSAVTIEPIIEAPEENQFIVTLGLAFILLAIIRIRFSTKPRQINLQLGEFTVAGVFIPKAQLISLAIAIAAIVCVWAFLNYTELGRAVRATADNRDGAWYMGINVPHIDYLTFGLGSALAGLAGAAIALFSAFDPSTGETYLVKAFIIVVLGGLGSFPGALVGGIIIGLVEVVGGYYLPGTVADIVVFAIFVGLLFIKPTGLFGREVE